MKELLFSLFFVTSSLTYADQHTVFAHGIFDGPLQIQRFETAIATPLKTAIQFCDAQPTSGWSIHNALGQITSPTGKKVNRTSMFMGQDADIETIHSAIQQIPRDHPIILYGCSRGAAALVTYLSAHNPTNIAALVLDACPANIPETISPKLAQLGIAPSMAENIFTWLFPRYNPQTAVTPEMAIAKIANKNLPILLIHSQDDSVVHYSHTLRLYQRFIAAKFTNVHLALIPFGRHSYLLQNPVVRPEYLKTVHSFYKKYNLSHDPAWTQPKIPVTKLTTEEIEQKITQHQQETNIKYLQSFKRNIMISSIFAFIVAYYLNPVPVPLLHVLNLF